MRLCLLPLVLLLLVAEADAAPMTERLVPPTFNKTCAAIGFPQIPATDLGNATIPQLINWLDPVCKLLGSPRVRNTPDGSGEPVFEEQVVGLAWSNGSLELTRLAISSDEQLSSIGVGAIIPAAEVDIAHIRVTAMPIEEYLRRYPWRIEGRLTVDAQPKAKGKFETDGHTVHLVTISAREDSEGFVSTQEAGDKTRPRNDNSASIGRTKRVELAFVDEPSAAKAGRALQRLFGLST
ncbi:MAG: hypothetical protein ABI743_10830, partial [bacterium]